MRSRWRWLPWALVGGLLLLTIASAVLSAATTAGPRRPPAAAAGPSKAIIIPAPFTGFGGYTWEGPTTSISARWVVPTITGNEADASASTWIGTQSEALNAFIQVGVTEEENVSGRPFYTAFWSDTPARFHAQFIASVSAGDQVAASMTQTGRGRVLHIDDMTKGWAHTVRSRYQGHGHFTQGEWIQEDPTPTLNASTDILYPTMSVTSFTDVLVDHRPPPLTFDDGSVLSSPNGIYLVPSPFRADGFSLPPARGAARQYLMDAGPFDGALTALNDRIETGPRLSTATRHADLINVIAAYGNLSGAISHQSWPPAVDAPLLVRDIGLVVTDYIRAVHLLPQAPASLIRRLAADELTLHAATLAARAALGPPLP